MPGEQGKRGPRRPVGHQGKRKRYCFSDSKLVVLQMNAKQSHARVDRIIEGEMDQVNHSQAHVIAFCDPSLAMAFCNTHEYVLDMHSSRPIVETDNPRNLKRRLEEYERRVKEEQDKKERKARTGRAPRLKPIEPVYDEPITLSRVFFCVHKSIARDTWSVDYHDGENKYLSATLFLETAIGKIAIHSVHNPNTEDQKIKIRPVYELVENQGLDLMVGDFNLHHPSWSAHLLKKGQTTSESNELSRELLARNV